MKTCKKILASILALAMVLSMCTFAASADETTETTETESTATSVLLIQNNFDSSTAGTVSKMPIDAGKITGNLNFRATTYGSNGITKGTVVAGENGDNYFTFKSSWFGYNVRTTDTVFATYDIANYPVLSISYDIMIPAEDTYKTHKRFGSFAMGTATTKKYSPATCIVYPCVTDGEIYATVDKATILYKKTIGYTYGDWSTIKINAWVSTDSKLFVVVYADNVPICIAESTATVVGIAAGDFNFAYNNAEDGSEKIEAKDKDDVWTDGILTYDDTAEDPENPAATIVSETAYDNIKVELLDESSKAFEGDLPRVDPVTLTENADGSVDAEAKVYYNAIDKGTLVAAICNGNGIVEEVITSNKLVTGNDYDSFKINVPADLLNKGYTVKGFLFDTLSSSKPLAENDKITITAE